MECVCSIEQTYRDVEMMIHKVVHTFLRKKNLPETDYEEWHGEACLAFMGALGSFNRKEGTRFTTWLWWNVWNNLSDKLQREAPHWLVSKTNGRTLDNFMDYRYREGDGSGLDLCLLSQDARMVVKIVFSSFGHIDGREEKPEEIRLSLYNLLCAMGWSARRVFESFHEIRIVLTR